MPSATKMHHQLVLGQLTLTPKTSIFIKKDKKKYYSNFLECSRNRTRLPLPSHPTNYWYKYGILKMLEVLKIDKLQA